MQSVQTSLILFHWLLKYVLGHPPLNWALREKKIIITVHYCTLYISVNLLFFLQTSNSKENLMLKLKIDAQTQSK